MVRAPAPIVRLGPIETSFQGDYPALIARPWSIFVVDIVYDCILDVSSVEADVSEPSAIQVVIQVRQ